MLQKQHQNQARTSLLSFDFKRNINCIESLVDHVLYRHPFAHETVDRQRDVDMMRKLKAYVKELHLLHKCHEDL